MLSASLEITTLQFVRIHSVNRKVLNENKTKRQRAKNNKKKELKVIIRSFWLPRRVQHAFQ